MNSENDRYWQELAEVDEREMVAMRQYYADLQAHNKAWAERWPHFCTHCGGWGYFFYPGKFSGPPENCYPDDQEPCYHLPEGSCHRCGAPDGYSGAELEGPCKHCGHQYDDGLRKD
jgi:hypothetical protein